MGMTLQLLLRTTEGYHFTGIVDDQSGIHAIVIAQNGDPLVSS